MSDGKKLMSFRLSDKAQSILKILAKEDGIDKTAVLENLLRQVAKDRNISGEETCSAKIYGKRSAENRKKKAEDLKKKAKKKIEMKG